jgi:hypothetical protein
MLHKQPSIIEAKTFRLIQELQTLPELKDFYLVGGTALALQLGHRSSIDIDLFSQSEFVGDAILSLLTKRYRVEEIYRRESITIALINNIKTDFITHDYPHLDNPITEEGITFLGKADIAAMKLQAIIQNGQRLKDFIHIYFLLEHFSMNQMVEFFGQKYTYTNPMIALKAVNFFDEIDEAIDPPKLLKPLSISQIKKRIQAATKSPDKIFQE